MGASTIANLAGLIDADLIVSEIKKSGNDAFAFTKGNSPFTIVVKDINKFIDRSIFVCYDEGNNSTYMSLRSNKHAVSILKPLVKYFGGEFAENDCIDQDPVIYDGLNTVNIDTPENRIKFNGSKISSEFKNNIIKFLHSNKEEILNYLSHERIQD